MSSFILLFRTAWNDYFTVANPTNLNSQTYTSRQTPSATSLYVSNCLFRSITSSSDGGALYCSNSVTFFLVESSSFFSCKTSGSQGGAIYFCHSSGQSVLHEVCGFDCCSTHTSPNYQFAYIQVNYVISNKNYVNYSSISRCRSENSNSYHILSLYCGKICCPSVNMSLNMCNRREVYCCPYGDSSSVTCSILFSSFTDNIATGCTCIMLWMKGAKFEIKSCNIIRNTQFDLATEGTIFTEGYVTIDNSCILENKATNIFRQHFSYTFTLSNCTVDFAFNNGCLTTQNTVTKSFILALNHMSTQNCHSEYDSVGYLGSSLKLKHSTYFKYFSQLRLSDFFSLANIFIFNFINP
jgi:hypothetical protein